jgi:hypothetical protein
MVRRLRLTPAAGDGRVVRDEDLYRDRWIRCTTDGLVIRCYSFPLGRAKRFAYRDIREVTVHEMGWLTGKGRIWGTSSPRVWASFDPGRPWKSQALILDVGKKVRPFITPDDPEAVRAIIESHR